MLLGDWKILFNQPLPDGTEEKEGREENPREGGRKHEKEGRSWYSGDSDLTPRW